MKVIILFVNGETREEWIIGIKDTRALVLALYDSMSDAAAINLQLNNGSTLVLNCASIAGVYVF